MADNRRRNAARRYRTPRQRRYVSARTKWTVALCALGLIAVALTAVAFYNGWIELPQEQQQPVQTQPITQPSDDTVIHFVAGGDVNITDKLIAAGGSGYDYQDILLDVLPVLSGSDLTVLNFEGNACGAPYGSAASSAPAQLLQALRNAGVDILQTANTQSLTNGLRGLRATNDAIRDAGMQPLGTYADAAEFEDAGGYMLYEIQGIKIALVAFTKGMDGRSLPQGGEGCVNLLYEDYASSYKTVDKDGITKILRAAERAEPDITIALLHWGSEYNDQISDSQRSICKLMAELGVDAIIGTHAHYVQSMGFDEKTGIFVAYSLGDFLGDAEIAGTNYSVLLDLQITKDGATGETSITGYSYTPIYQYYDEEGNLQLLRIREAMAAYENDYIGKISAQLYESMKYCLGRIEARVAG